MPSPGTPRNPPEPPGTPGTLEGKNGFGAEVEEEVEDAEVGEEGAFVVEDLVVGLGDEAGGFGGSLGVQAVAEVSPIGRELAFGEEGFGFTHRGVYPQQVADGGVQGLVEIEEVAGSLFEEGTEVVLVIIKIGTGFVGSDQGVPVQVLPVAVLG